MFPFVELMCSLEILYKPKCYFPCVVKYLHFNIFLSFEVFCDSVHLWVTFQIKQTNKQTILSGLSTIFYWQ